MVFGSATGIALDVIIVAVAVTGILPWAVEPGSLPYFVGLTGAFLALLLIPLSIGVAMLRYRLWDIDLLINRTLLYGGLTVALGLVYLSGVVVLQAVFRTLTGQGQSPLVTIGSTLTIAALFNPLRRRLQTWIDQRFFRRKYDAAKTLAAFGAKMRDETDLNALLADLLRVVAETMQPTHSSLWLRPPERKVRRQAYGNDP